MSDLTLETLKALVAELDGYAWSEAELTELVTPRLGIISGFSGLLASHARIRALDLPGLEGGPFGQDEPSE